MTIVRELVTRLSFAFDKTNFVKFERAISDFKTKFDVAKLFVGNFFSKIFDFAQQIAHTATSFKNIADYTGTAYSDLLALQRVAAKFNIDKSSFAGFFQSIGEGINEASVGVQNFITEIRKNTLGRVSFLTDTGERNSVLEWVKALGKELETISNRSDALFVISQVPGVGIENASKFLDLLTQINPNLSQLIEYEKEAARASEAAFPDIQRYTRDVANLTVEFEKFATRVGQVVVPILGQVFGGLNDILNFEGGIASGFLEGLRATFESFTDLFRSDESIINRKMKKFNVDTNFKGPIEENQVFQSLLRDQAANINNSPTLTVNNKFEISTQAGTGEQQTNIILEGIKLAQDQYWNEKVREVVLNNPVVE